MEDWLVLIVGIIALAAVYVFYIYKNDYASYMNIQSAYDRRPVLWVYVDDSDVNTRYWSDFGARSSRALNVPFLNMCYSTIARAAEPHYRVEMINGVADAVEKLGGASHVPDRLVGLGQKKVLGPLEKAYIRVAFLERYGGLWMPLSTICLQQIPVLPDDKVVFFGTRRSEMYASALPGTDFFWSPKPAHPIMSVWADMLQRRMEDGNGGSWVRGDDALDMDALLNGYKDDIVVMRGASLDHKANGKAIGIEDYLAHGTEGVLPFVLTVDALFMPVDYIELERRRAYGWFLKMSESQIMESDLVIKYVIESALA